MSGKTVMPALALAAAMLIPSTAAVAADSGVTVLRGQQASAAPQVSDNEGGTGVAVYRGPPRAAPRRPAAAAPVTYIGRNRVAIDSLEPAGNWFLDRSGEGLVVVNCYTQQSINVGGNRRIRCTSREF